MGWPDSPYLWRENAKPAQEQYTAVAKAISQFEPLTMLANTEARSHFMPACCMRRSCVLFGLFLGLMLCRLSCMISDAVAATAGVMFVQVGQSVGMVL